MKPQLFKNKCNKKTPLLMSPFGFALAACGGGETDLPGIGGSPSGAFVQQRLSVADISDYFSLLNLHPADFDQDGDTDFIVSHGSFPPGEQESYAAFALINHDGVLQRQDIDGSPPLMTHAREGAFADFNNDGILDFILVGHGWDTAPFPGEPNALFYGSREGFVDMSSLLPADSDFTHSVAVGDLNNDNFADIYVGNTYGENRIDPYLLINQAGAGFVKVGLNEQDFGLFSKKYLSAEIIDIDDDGTVDLIVGGQGGNNLIYQYDVLNEEMILAQILPEGHFGTDGHTVDLKAGDLNNDGLLDLVMLSTADYSGLDLQILIQTDDGTFEDQTDQALPTFDRSQDWTPFIALADVDQDGDLDILLSQTSERGPNAYLNNDGVFVESNADHKLEGFRNFYNVGLDQNTGDLFAANVAGGILTVEQIIL